MKVLVVDIFGLQLNRVFKKTARVGCFFMRIIV